MLSSHGRSCSSVNISILAQKFQFLITVFPYPVQYGTLPRENCRDVVYQWRHHLFAWAAAGVRCCYCALGAISVHSGAFLWESFAQERTEIEMNGRLIHTYLTWRAKALPRSLVLVGVPTLNAIDGNFIHKYWRARNFPKYDALILWQYCCIVHFQNGRKYRLCFHKFILSQAVHAENRSPVHYKAFHNCFHCWIHKLWIHFEFSRMEKNRWNNSMKFKELKQSFTSASIRLIRVTEYKGGGNRKTTRMHDDDLTAMCFYKQNMITVHENTFDKRNSLQIK